MNRENINMFFTPLPFEEHEKKIRAFINQIKASDNLVKAEEKILAASSYEIVRQKENDIWLKLFVDDETYWEHINAIDTISEAIVNRIKQELELFYGMFYISIIKTPMQVRGIDNSHVLFYSKDLSPEAMVRIWGKNNAFKIFISHKDNCKIDANKLKEEFARYGITCFVAHVDIEPTQEWANEIKSALFSCDACLALMSDCYHDSKWTDQEIGCCLGRNVPVLAIRWTRLDENGVKLPGIAPYGLIGITQGMLYNSDGDYHSLVNSIMKYLLRNEIVQNAFIREIGFSESWNMANNLASFFECIPSLKPYQLDDAITYWKRNPETRNAFAFKGGNRDYGYGFVHYLRQWRNNLFSQSKSEL